VNTPASIAGDYFAQSAAFGPALTPAGVTGDVVAALDPADASGPSTFDACSPLTNGPAVSGKIALVDRGTCLFVTKVLNAQAAGAIGVIVANNAATGLPGMGGASAEVTIPSLGVQQAVGAAIRTAGAVNATLRAQPGTDETYRWLLGEDTSPESFNGAIRDMSNPSCYSDPGKVTDTAFYVCGAEDGGGVHSNSGVPNHGFALLVDGGTYNGQTIAPIGITKAAHLYYRAQTAYQVEDSDFADHADALELSCGDLVGVPLNALTGGPSTEIIVASDCEQVTKMIAAVELRTEPTFCNFRPLLNPSLDTPLCSATTTTGVVQPITAFDFETDPSATWTASRTTASPDFTPRDWTWVNALPSGRAGSGFFAPNPDIGTCERGGDESGVLHLTSPAITLPNDINFAGATFEHWVATEAGFDGGNLKISVNGGPWQLVPPSEYTFNGYNALLVTAAQGNTNPLAGQPAWTGTDAGSVHGSWGRTYVNVGNFAQPGATIRLRWDLGSDGCAGRVGWYLDNVELFSCTPNVPSVTVADIAFPEGDAGTTEVFFTVRLSAPTIARVAVNFQIVDGTARHGNDFEVAGAGTLVIPAGQTSGRITIAIKGDIVPEGNEFFTLRLIRATNATIEDGEALATIHDDDTTPPGPKEN
jgi:Thermolysin metallopeptidase, alpha-helical domain/PA domain/Calx-beta domain